MHHRLREEEKQQLNNQSYREATNNKALIAVFQGESLGAKHELYKGSWGGTELRGKDKSKRNKH